jgi:hypothetical protein
MTWAALAEELDLDVSGYTLKRHIGSMDYHKCIAWCKGWISGKLAPNRLVNNQADRRLDC